MVAAGGGRFAGLGALRRLLSLRPPRSLPGPLSSFSFILGSFLFFPKLHLLVVWGNWHIRECRLRGPPPLPAIVGRRWSVWSQRGGGFIPLRRAPLLFVEGGGAANTFTSSRSSWRFKQSYWPAIGGHGPCAHKCGAECMINLFPQPRGGVSSLVLWEQYRHCEGTLGTV